MIRFTSFFSSFLLFVLELMIGREFLPVLGGAYFVWPILILGFQIVLLFAYMAVRTETKHHLRGGFIQIGLCLFAVCLFILPHQIVLLFGTLIFLALVGARAEYVSQQKLRSTIYVASTAGALLALFIYPILFETYIPFAIGARIVACLSILVAYSAHTLQASDSQKETIISSRIRYQVIGVGFVSSVLLVVSTDGLVKVLSNTPLVWVWPLFAYLFAFIVAFSDKKNRFEFLYPLCVALSSGCIIAEYFGVGLWMSLSINVCFILLGAFFPTLWFGRQAYKHIRAHGNPYHLYIALLIGGIFGTVFATLVIPFIFTSSQDFLVLFILLCSTALIYVVYRWMRPGIFIAALVLLCGVARLTPHMVYFRNLYGSISVSDSIGTGGRDVRSLWYGDIVHGSAFITKAASTPTTYYGARSGVDFAFNALQSDSGKISVGGIGLGVGTIASYCHPGDVFTFYELNPDVVKAAKQYFPYIKECANVTIDIGDGRLLMKKLPNSFDLIVVDAFDAGSIPTHLFTKEALDTYLARLNHNGIIAYHITSRTVDLAPILGKLASSEGLSTVVVEQAPDFENQLFENRWVLMSKDASVINLIEQQAGEQASKISVASSTPLWTDDLTPVLKSLHVW